MLKLLTAKKKQAASVSSTELLGCAQCGVPAKGNCDIEVFRDWHVGPESLGNDIFDGN